MARRKTKNTGSVSNYDEINIKILLLEIFIIAIVAGFYYHSWWVFGGVVVGLFIALNIRILAIIINIIFSLGWAFIGFTIGTYTNNTTASIVLALIALVAGLLFHKSGIKWTKNS